MEQEMCYVGSGDFQFKLGRHQPPKKVHILSTNFGRYNCFQKVISIIYGIIGRLCFSGRIPDIRQHNYRVWNSNCISIKCQCILVFPLLFELSQIDIFLRNDLFFSCVRKCCEIPLNISIVGLPCISSSSSPSSSPRLPPRPPSKLIN